MGEVGVVLKERLEQGKQLSPATPRALSSSGVMVQPLPSTQGPSPGRESPTG